MKDEPLCSDKLRISKEKISYDLEQISAKFSILCLVGRMKHFSLSGPRSWIAEELLYEDLWVWDFALFQTDMIWVAVKNLFVVHSSVWNFDRGKLIEFHYFEAVEKCHTQKLEAGRKAKNNPSRVTTFSVSSSPFMRISQMSHWYASAANMCSVRRIIFEEREEDLIPVGMVALTFC